MPPSDEKMSGPLFRIGPDGASKKVGTLTLERDDPGETVYEAPDTCSSIGYSASYAASFDRVFRKPSPEELN